MNKEPERLDSFEQGNKEQLQLPWNGEIKGKKILEASEGYQKQLQLTLDAKGTTEEGFAQDKLEKAKFNALTVSGVMTGFAYNSKIYKSLPHKGWRDLAANDDFVGHIADSALGERIATGEVDIHGQETVKKSYTMGENDHARRYGFNDVAGVVDKLDKKYSVDTSKDDNGIPFTLEETSGYKIIKQGDQLKDSSPEKASEPGQVVFANMADQLAKYGTKENPYVVQNPDTSSSFADEAFQAKKALHERGLDINLDTPLVTVNNFSSEEQAAKKAEWIRNNPVEAAADVTEKVNNIARNEYRDQIAEEAFQAKKALHERGLDLNLDVSLTEEMQKDAETRLKQSIEESTRRHLGEMSEIKVESIKKTLTSAELLLLAEEGLKGCKEAMPKVEKVKDTLEKRNEGIMSRLSNMGLKGVDYYKGMKPRNKILLGIALAGASVLSGGGIIGATVGGAMKVISAATNARGFYQGIEKAEKDENAVEPNKKWLAARSILYGTLLAAGTSLLFTEIASHFNHDVDPVLPAGSSVQEPIVQTPAAIQTPTPVITPTPDAGFGSTYVAPDAGNHVAPGPVQNPDQGFGSSTISAPEVISNAPVSINQTPEGVFAYQPSPINFGDMDYVIKQGDSYSNVMDRILPHVKGSELLDANAKSDLLKSFHDQYGKTGLFSGASTYPDMISSMDAHKVGGVVRVDQLKSALEEEVKRRFPGSLLN